MRASEKLKAIRERRKNASDTQVLPVPQEPVQPLLIKEKPDTLEDVGEEDLEYSLQNGKKIRRRERSGYWSEKMKAKKKLIDFINSIDDLKGYFGSGLNVGGQPVDSAPQKTVVEDKPMADELKEDIKSGLSDADKARYPIGSATETIVVDKSKPKRETAKEEDHLDYEYSFPISKPEPPKKDKAKEEYYLDRGLWLWN